MKILAFLLLLLVSLLAFNRWLFRAMAGHFYGSESACREVFRRVKQAGRSNSPECSKLELMGILLGLLVGLQVVALRFLLAQVFP